MNVSPNSPRDDDAVLGSQALPPVGSVILGGLEGLRQRLAGDNCEQRIAALADALNYGEAGIDLLIEAMNDAVIAVRAIAYRLLQGVQSRKSQQAIAKGLLLNPGDRIYSVYKSEIGYGDDSYYLINRVTSSVEKYYLYYAGRHFDDNR